MKKQIFNEDWEIEEIEDLSDLFVVLLKHGSFDAGYTEMYSTDEGDALDAFNGLVSQYSDVGCDDLTRIYIIKVPNTEQVSSMLEPTLYNGNSNDPTMLSLLQNVYNRADAEEIACWNPCLTEGKKKKKPYSSMGITTGDIGLNIKHFNKRMGTDGLGDHSDDKPLVDFVITGNDNASGGHAPAASADGGESSGEISGGEGISESAALQEAGKGSILDSAFNEYQITYKPFESDDSKLFKKVKNANIAIDLAKKLSNQPGIDSVEVMPTGADKPLLILSFGTVLENNIEQLINDIKNHTDTVISASVKQELIELNKLSDDEIIKKLNSTGNLKLKDYYVVCTKTNNEFNHIKELIKKTLLAHGGKYIIDELGESLNEGCWNMPYSVAMANRLKALMQKPCPKKWVGDGGSKNDELGIGDDELYDRLSHLGDDEDARPIIQQFIKKNVLPEWDNYSYSGEKGDNEGHKWEKGVKEIFQEIAGMKLSEEYRPDFKPLSEEEIKEITDKLYAISDKYNNEGESKLTIANDDSSKVQYFEQEGDEDNGKDERFEFQVYGGLNGSGDWEDYFKHLGELFAEIHAETKWNPRVAELSNDMLDDVFYVKVVMFKEPVDESLKEKLTEDLIVIEPEEAKGKFESLIDQIKACEDPDVKDSLLTLLNIYLFQTYKPSDRDNSSITDDEWQEYSDFREAETEESAEEESPEDDGSLTEASLNYNDQLMKMKALENGTRGFNATAASDEKLEFNWRICKKEGLLYALSIVEDEMIRRGGRLADLVNARKIIDLKAYRRIFDPGYCNSAAAKTVWSLKDDAAALTDAYGANIDDMLLILVLALLMKQKDLADRIKDYILARFGVPLQELKDFLNGGFADKNFLDSVMPIVHKVCNESLNEDAGYSHKLEGKFELPPQIKLLDQKQVEDFIKQLAPEELFGIGYVTPLYFYSELDDKFDLVKATEMEGYTGLDYRDASVNATNHDERVANAQRQIDTYTDGAQGHKLNREGERFSTSYRSTNKLALNPSKSNEYVEYELDADGKPIVDADGRKVVKSKIDMNKILFYPRVGSTPTTHYYIDFHNGQGFKSVKRDVLVDTLYKFILEVEKANEQGISKSDLLWLQKKGYGNVRKDSQGAIDAFYAANGKKIPIWAHRKAEEAGVTPEEYYKEHPFSSR